MRKAGLIVILLGVLSGCGFKYDIDPALIPEPTQRPVVTKTIDPDKPFYYGGYNNYESTLRIPIFENNSCLSDESIIVMVTSYDDQLISIEIGDNCMTLDGLQGLQVNMDRDILSQRYEVDLPNGAAVFDLLKIYYKLPEGVVAQDYLDFLNYGYRIEHTGQVAE